MAFSMFLRSSAYNNRLLSQGVLKLASQPQLASRCFASLPATNTVVTRDIKINTPVLNAVRAFRTSSVCRSSDVPHDHARLWVIEKLTSVLLVPLIPLGLLMPNKLFDLALAILIVAHSHWGLEAVAVDYIRASIFGPFLPKLAIALVYLFSISTLAGLLYIITHDIGIGNTVRKLWSVQAQNKS